MKSSRKGPSWTAIGTVVAICSLPAAGMLAIAWFCSGMKGWSDGAGVYESHAIRESLPLFALAAIPLAYLPPFSRRISGALLVLSFALSIAYIIHIFTKIGVGNALNGVMAVGIIIWGFWSARMSLEKEEPNQAPEPTAPSGRGSS